MFEDENHQRLILKRLQPRLQSVDQQNGLEMVLVECSYEYEGLRWEDVNSFSEKAKRECLMDPDKVEVKVDERPDGSTAYLFSGKVNFFYQTETCSTTIIIVLC
jgi:hypothetical protein